MSQTINSKTITPDWLMSGLIKLCASDRPTGFEFSGITLAPQVDPLQQLWNACRKDMHLLVAFRVSVRDCIHQFQPDMGSKEFRAKLTILLVRLLDYYPSHEAIITVLLLLERKRLPSHPDLLARTARLGAKTSTDNMMRFEKAFRDNPQYWQPTLIIPFLRQQLLITPKDWLAILYNYHGDIIEMGPNGLIHIQAIFMHIIEDKGLGGLIFQGLGLGYAAKHEAALDLVFNHKTEKFKIDQIHKNLFREEIDNPIIRMTVGNWSESALLMDIINPRIEEIRMSVDNEKKFDLLVTSAIDWTNSIRKFRVDTEIFARIN